MTKFEEYCARQKARHGDQFVAPKGEHLIEAYNRGTRVKVCTTYPTGEKFERCGYVALTTGWKPSFMLMTTRRQDGSSDLLNEDDKIERYIKERS